MEKIQRTKVHKLCNVWQFRKSIKFKYGIFCMKNCLRFLRYGSEYPSNYRRSTGKEF